MPNKVLDMWSLVIALMFNTTPSEIKFINLAQFKTYQECRDLSKTLKDRGLDAHLFCVEKQ
jgi:hypothetical protein